MANDNKCKIPYGNVTNGSRNIFLTGDAGTGKTYQIDKFCEENPDLNILKVAPTGTAAVKCGGVTIHSCGVPVPCYGVDIRKTPDAKIKFLSVADVIIIDEISMVRCDVFSYFIRLINKANTKRKQQGKDKIRIIVCGDFSQLPPVVPKTDKNNLKKCGYDESGYPFTTKEWQSLNFKVIELTKVYRQNDTTYIDNLNALKKGKFSAVEYFNSFVKDDYIEMPDTVYLCGTNARADKINEEYLESIDEYPILCKSRKTGNTFKAGNYIDEKLELKVGARVMFTVNDIDGLKMCGKQRFYNGTFGEIEAIYPQSKTIINDKGEEIELPPRIDVRVNGEIIKVFQYQYKINDIKVEGRGTSAKLVNKELGSIYQFPVKIAKAITIHKSQGQTYNNVVLEPDVFAHGMLYVALSRVKGPEGLVLTKEISEDLLSISDDIVDDFISNGYEYKLKPVKRAVTKKGAVKKKVGNSSAKKTASKKKTTAKTTSKSAKKTTRPTASKKKTASKAKKKPTKKVATRKSTSTKKKITKSRK